MIGAHRPVIVGILLCDHSSLSRDSDKIVYNVYALAIACELCILCADVAKQSARARARALCIVFFNRVALFILKHASPLPALEVMRARISR